MSQNNGSIYAPVEIRDAYNCLGVASYNNNFDLTYICCNEHEKINKWSKKKPIEWNKIDNLTDDEFRQADYGIITPNGHKEPQIAVEQQYIYKFPVNWKRLGDFDGYYHIASSPCIKQTDVNISIFQGSGVNFVPNIISTSDNRCIDTADFSWLNNCYAALVFRITNGNITTLYYRTSDYKIGDKSTGEWIVRFLYNEPPFDDSRTIISNAMWVACINPHPAGSTQPYLQTFYPLPYNNPIDAKFNVFIDRKSPIIMSVIGLKQNTIGSDFDLIEDYGDSSNYYYLTNGGTLYFVVDIQNKINQEFILNLSFFKLSSTKSFAQNNVGKPTGDVIPKVYSFTSEWVDVGTLFKIPANSKDMYLIGVKNFMAYYNGVEYPLAISSLEDVYSKATYNSVIMMNTPPIRYRT